MSFGQKYYQQIYVKPSNNKVLTYFTILHQILEGKKTPNWYTTIYLHISLLNCRQGEKTRDIYLFTKCTLQNNTINDFLMQIYCNIAFINFLIPKIITVFINSKYPTSETKQKPLYKHKIHRTHLLNFFLKLIRAHVKQRRAHVHNINKYKSQIPHQSVKVAFHRPAPQGEKNTAHEQSAPQIKHPICAIWCQVRQKKEHVCYLKVDVIQLAPMTADLRTEDCRVDCGGISAVFEGIEKIFRVFGLGCFKFGVIARVEHIFQLSFK